MIPHVFVVQDILELEEIPPASPREKKKVHFNLVPMIKTTTDDHPTTTTRIVRKIVRKVQVRRVRQSLHLDRAFGYTKLPLHFPFHFVSITLRHILRCFFPKMFQNVL